LLESAIAFAGQLLQRRESPVNAARLAAQRCIDASGHLSLADGLRLEEELVNELITSPESQARRAAFLASRK